MKADSPQVDLVRELEHHAQPLAQAVVAAMEATDPLLVSRYGRAGLDRCVQDTVFHLQHLAAALDVDDPGELRQYRRWLSTVLGTRDVPEADIDANFGAIATVLRDRYGAAADAAVRFLESCRPEAPR